MSGTPRVAASVESLAATRLFLENSQPALATRHRSPSPSRLLSANGHARFACSLASALTTARFRYQPFAVSLAATRLFLENSQPALATRHRSPSPLRLLSASDPARFACSLASALAAPPLRYQSLAVSFAATFLFWDKQSRFRKTSPLQRSVAAPLRKRSRSVRLFACKRAHDGSLSLPTVCGSARLRRGRQVDSPVENLPEPSRRAIITRAACITRRAPFARKKDVLSRVFMIQYICEIVGRLIFIPSTGTVPLRPEKGASS